MKLINIVKSAFIDGNFFVIIKKAWLRFFDRQNILSREENIRWFNDNKSNISNFCCQIDHSLWDSIQSDINKVRLDSNKTLETIEHNLGGGGAYPLLYFIVRFVKPMVVVETGVASGFSTHAILDALEKNKKGALFSSDLPYFRISDPNKYIGIVVPEGLKKRWNLFVEGDDVNLIKISNKVNMIDVFHYDSDKSFNGRLRALKILEKNINSDTWMIFDDIQDNSFFHEFVYGKNLNWKVFEFEGKWVGLVIPKSLI